MKNIITLIFFFISLNVFAVEVDIISAEFGVEDYTHRKTLCLTVVRVPKTGSLLGVVEPIEDCFYARSAKKSQSNRLELPLKKMKKIDDPKLRDHLQRLDTQLEFYFSDGE